MKPLYIFGSSGHAKVVLDVARRTGEYDVRGFFDDNPARWEQTLLDYPIWGGRDHLQQLDPSRDLLFVAIGNNRVRHALGEEIRARGFALATLIHPSAQIAMDVEIGAGTVLMAGAIVNTSARIGSHCILNTACSVDHDCVLGDAVHVCPGTRLAGDVKIGDESWIGIGSCVIEGRTLGSQVVVGAGAAVIRDVPGNTTVVGIPARPIR